MEKINQTPKPPYYAVIFTSIKSDHLENYAEEALRMENLVKSQPAYLGHESASSEIGITVSYWKDLESIKAWKTIRITAWPKPEENPLGTVITKFVFVK